MKRIYMLLALGYIDNYTDVDTVMTINYWGPEYSRTIFSKSVGAGQVTVFGPYFESWYEEEAQMIANAVEFTAGDGGFSITPNNGILSMDESVSLSLNYSTFDMIGDFSGNVSIYSNDPENSQIDIPILVTVNGAPDIASNMESLNFGDIILGSTISGEVLIENMGTLPLEISSVYVDPDRLFSVESAATTLEPGEVLPVTVNYYPESMGEDFAELIIISNDPNESDFRIPIIVNVLPAPFINISETALTVDVNSFEYDTSEVIISNSGDGYLDYDFSLISTTDHTEIVNFTKEDYADWTLEENQDRISSTVWLTRQDNQGIFNAYYQESYDPNGPYGTSWRWGCNRG